MDTNISYDFRSAKKAFSRVGIALLMFFVATFASQILIGFVLGLVAPDIALEGLSYTASLIVSTSTMYLIGFPVFYLCLRRVDTFPAQAAKCSAGTFVSAFAISMTLMFIGQMIGDSVTSFIYNTTKIMPSSQTLEIVSNIKWYEALVFTVLIGPLVEELMFRKLIIDRTRGFGEKLSVIFSAIMFAFFHMSVQQAFYSFLIGLLYGYLYIRKGRVLYCWALHAAFNFFGSVLPLILMQYVDLESFLNAASPEEMYAIVEGNLTGFGAVAAFSLLEIVLSFVGLNLLLKKYRNIRFERALFELPKDSEATTAFVNFGVIFFIAFTIAYPILTALL